MSATRNNRENTIEQALFGESNKINQKSIYVYNIYIYMYINIYCIEKIENDENKYNKEQIYKVWMEHYKDK